MSDSLQELWNETQGFYERFDIYPPKRDQSLAKFCEEVGEFIEAVAQYDADPTEANLRAMLGELGDLVVTGVVGIPMGRGLGIEDVWRSLRKVAEKNRDKTDVTHFKDTDGFVRRRE